MPVTPASDLTPSSHLHGHQHTPGISEYVHKNKKFHQNCNPSWNFLRLSSLVVALFCLQTTSDDHEARRVTHN